MPTPIVALYYPNQTSPTLSVLLEAADPRPVRPLDPVVDYNAEYDLNAGGKFISRVIGEERDRYILKPKGIDATLMAEYEAFFDQVDKSWRTFVYMHRDETYHTVRWITPFGYTQVGSKYDLDDIVLEEEL